MENKSLEQRMETEPVHRVILSLAAPTVLSMLVISAYSIVDTFFVTRLGSRATGAVGITFALVAWIQAVGYTVTAVSAYFYKHEINHEEVAPCCQTRTPRTPIFSLLLIC